MKHLLLTAKAEILELRRMNALLEAQMHVVNVFAAALLGPRTHPGMSPDVAWALQRAIDDMKDDSP